MASFVKPQKGKELRSGLSKWELEELTKERRKTLSKKEVQREILADGLRCPLCFSLPCAIIALLLLILMSIYIVHPYRVGRSLIKTQCQYNRTEFQPTWTGYCSHRTNRFKPCFKIFVTYNSTSDPNTQSILLENEQALVHCDRCSFTQGRSGMFNKQTVCAWNTQVDLMKCIPEYLQKYGSPNSTYPCYYDPNDTQNVVAVLQISSSEAALAIFVPLILLIVWLVALAVLLYDRYRRRILDGHILVQRQDQNKVNGNIDVNGAAKPERKSRNPNIDLDEVSTAHDNPTDTTMVTTPRRKRKKKMPCRKPHYVFNYLDEGIVLEDKPISPPVDNQPLDFNYLTIDTSPGCNCSHMDSIDILPDLGDHYTSHTPSHVYGVSSGKTPGKILKYLPESFV